MGGKTSDSPAAEVKTRSFLLVAVMLTALCLSLAGAYFVGKSAGQGGQKVVSVAPAGEEAEVLSAQVAEMQRSEDRLLTVVMAMMGISAAVLVAFGAIALYLGGQQYQRDKDAMETVIKADTRSRIDQFSASEARIRQEHFEAINTTLRDFLSQIEKKIENVQKGIVQNDLEIKKMQEETRGQIASILRTQLLTYNRLERSEAEIDLTHRDYSSAISHFTSVLKNSDNPPNWITDYLDLSKASQVLRGATAASHWIPINSLNELQDILSEEGSTFRWIRNRSLVSEVLSEIAIHNEARERHLAHQAAKIDPEVQSDPER